jgi:hypothetical protein
MALIIGIMMERAGGWSGVEGEEQLGEGGRRDQGGQGVMRAGDVMSCGCGASIWNPVHLDRIGQIGTYWYVAVRTGTTRYKAVR